MQKRKLGNSGLDVSVVGLGCNNFGGKRIDLEASRAVVHKAIDLGITLFDTADTYGGRGGSETILGQILGEHRKDIVLATKFGLDMDDSGTKKGGSRRYIIEAVEASLRRLKTDWIDLYQYHFPDPLTPLEETLRTLDDLVTQGKVRYIGCSNLPAWQLVDAWWIAETKNLTHFISCQDQYSLLHRKPEAELMRAAKRCSMGFLPYFPLASGLLTGKYSKDRPLPAGSRMAREQVMVDRYLSDKNWAIAQLLSEFAERNGHTILELAFSWLLAQVPVASVIAGATSSAQVEQNSQAASWVLTAEQLAEVDRITQG